MRLRTDVRMKTPKGGGIIFPHFVHHFARRAGVLLTKAGPSLRRVGFFIPVISIIRGYTASPCPFGTVGRLWDVFGTAPISRIINKIGLGTMGRLQPPKGGG
jgi:hypothetical protein